MVLLVYKNLRIACPAVGSAASRQHGFVLFHGEI